MKKTGQLFIDMIAIIRRLRGPGGCPWDQKQTPQDVKAYLIEELYELLEGIDADDPALLQEEVGDILFMIAFLVNLYEEKNVFTMAACPCAGNSQDGAPASPCLWRHTGALGR